MHGLHTLPQPNPPPQNSIFSSIVASFIIQTSQALQPNNSQETVCLLSQLVSQGDSTQQSSPLCPALSPAAPSEAAIQSNILLFISFSLSMMSVLACALIQQWCREFMTCAHYRGVPYKRGRVRTYLFLGLHQFHMREFVHGVHVILHVSVFLFFCGVSVYLHDVYPRVGMVAWYCTIALAVVYAALSILPLIMRNCPYHTALTPPLRFCRTLLLRTLLTFRLMASRHGQFQTLPRRHHFKKIGSLEEEANSRAAQLDTLAMQWLFLDNDIGDIDMDTFLEGLPGYIHSRITDEAKNGLLGILTQPYILQRIREHLLTCVRATNLPEEARVKRVLTCVESLRVILLLWTSAECPKRLGEEELLRYFMRRIVKDFTRLCEERWEKEDLRAFCVRALAFQGFLTKCLEPVRKESPHDVPAYFIPLYDFFFSNLPVPSDNASVTQPQDTEPLCAKVAIMEAPLNVTEDPRWRLLLHDGPFINLTLLAKAILSHGEDDDPSTLCMCSNILDILRREFRINSVDVHDSSLALFYEVHRETRRRVMAEMAERRGFSLIPLLEVLDAVDGGRRLSIIFRDHPDPEPKYHPKADLVFGKDHLQNPDLFRAFASRLPHFITNHPKKSTELMEGLVRHDYLWTSLQVHLSNTLEDSGSVPDMLLDFETCCTVIDAAFVALENSKVDWRAPDFGPIAHSFELFATDCFRGVFRERAVGFRVGLFKARFCRAVLAQFLDEFKHEGTIVIRSQWEVASLARVLYSLGVGDDADEEFWKLFVDGGPIGPVLMGKTHTSLDQAQRDGRLLNFCRLGHLGMMAVPFKGSGLRDTDFEKLLDLMKKVSEDQGLPLTEASTRVWEELRQLRDEAFDKLSKNDQVVEILDRSSEEQGEEDKDKVNMEKLLKTIDTVYYQHYSSSSAQEVDSEGTVFVTVTDFLFDKPH